MNQGSVAGAGIAAHLHQHVVPRWGGDANFMPVIGRTKVLPQLLADTRRPAREGLAALTHLPDRRLPHRGVLLADLRRPGAAGIGSCRAYVRVNVPAPEVSARSSTA